MGLWQLLGAFVLGALSWVPCDVSQFWIEPNAPSVLSFEASKENEDDAIDGNVEFIVRTTDGEEFCRGVAERADNALRIETVLPQGYFELEFPETNQTFGVSSQPSYCPCDSIMKTEEEDSALRPRDPFFGIDAASTWLVGSDKAREELIKCARRFGLTNYRERLNWSRIQPQKDSLDLNGDNRSEFVRKTVKKYGLSSLELFHNAPDWTGHVGKYPEDLIALADTWGETGARWNQYWNAIEVWNEPDISFSGDLPGDQYAPILKTVAQEFSRRSVETPIVGGIIAAYRDQYMDCLAANGVLDACDIFSFHTYCRAYDMEAVSLRYCDWLARNNAAGKPLWITECGQAWQRGTDRPKREEDVLSAIDIVQKGVAAKAMGIDAYFPFVYPFYEERDKNFGMCDRNNAPMRSCAGYARSVYLLSGKVCAGSWVLDEDASASDVERSYIFVDPKSGEKVAVLYARSRKDGRTVTLPHRPKFVERVTGEPLEVDERNKVDFTDGFLFVGLEDDYSPKFADASDVDRVRENRLAARNNNDVKPRRDSAIAMRFDFSSETTTYAFDGYKLVDSNADRFEGKVSVYNFDAQPKTLPIRAFSSIEVDGTEREIDVALSAPDTIDVPARGRAVFNFVIDPSKISPFEPLKLKFEAGDEGMIAFNVARSVTEQNFNSVVGKFGRIDLTDVSRWRKNLPANGQMDFIVPADDSNNQSWGFDAKYAEGGDHWAFPIFSLAFEEGTGRLLVEGENGAIESLDVSKLRGVAMRVKGTSDSEKSSIRFFTYDKEGKNYFYTQQEIAPADGEERFIVATFDSLIPWSHSGKFDPTQIGGISIGGNTKGSALSVEVKDFFIF